MSENHLSVSELETGLEHVRQSPKDEGMLEMIVCRPSDDERRVLSKGRLDLAEGLIGDNWKSRGSRGMPDRSAHPEMQINIMNSRVIALIAQEKGRWQLAGDQLFVDLDLSEENLPPGTHLKLGNAILEVTAKPHTGCNKFAARYGEDARKFVNSPVGKQMHLRGVNAKVIQPGDIRVGDIAKKIQRAS
jgi:MOSC domain-containing protein YiiM